VFSIETWRIMLPQRPFMNTYLDQVLFLPIFVKLSMVTMKDNKEEYDDDNVPGFTEYGASDGTSMDEAKEQVVAEDELTNNVGQAIRNAQRDYKSKNKRIEFQHML
jgi:galactose-1-phosphate uridylyltransferase